MPFAVEDNDFISASVDQLLPLETLQRLGDARPALRPASAPRIRVLADSVLSPSAVVSHQNPPRQTLVDMGASVGDGGVCRLHHEHLDEFEQQAVQGSRSHSSPCAVPWR